MAHAINDNYDPSGKYEDAILEYLEDEHRLGPTDIAEGVDAHRSAINHHLHRLNAAGWIRKPHGEGLYEFVCDPREMDDEDIAEMHIARALQLLELEHLDAAPVVENLRDAVVQ